MTTINVERLELEKSGQRGSKPWTLFRVHGTYADGSPLVNVKTFDHIPAGDGITVELDPYTSDEGASFTAKLPRAAKGRTRQVGPSNAGQASNSSSNFEQDVLDRLERIERTLKALVSVYDPQSVGGDDA